MKTLFEIIAYSFILGSLSAFLVIVGRKTGALDFVQARTVYWLPWGCDFCLSFWFSILMATLAVIFLVPFGWYLLIVPGISTMVSHMMLRL